MLFSAAGGLSCASGHKKDFASLKGSAYRNPVAAVAFIIGSLSMIGIPFFAGFAAKYYLSMAAMGQGVKMWVALFALAVSTVLNALYYIRALSVIFSKKEGESVERYKNPKTYTFAMIVFIVVNVLFGIFYQPVMNIIATGMGLLA